eukprot:scaffold190701_cov17-Tisochrysis_lutea.AAC.1
MIFKRLSVFCAVALALPAAESMRVATCNYRCVCVLHARHVCTWKATHTILLEAHLPLKISHTMIKRMGAVAGTPGRPCHRYRDGFSLLLWCIQQY